MNTRQDVEDLAQLCHVRLLAFDFLKLETVPSGPYARRSRPVRKVEMVGVVVSVEVKLKYIRFSLDDGTGCVPCILWTNYMFSDVEIRSALNRQAADLSASQSGLVSLGRLVRAQGRVSTYNRQLEMTVSAVLAEADPNAEVFHWMESMKLAMDCYDNNQA